MQENVRVEEFLSKMLQTVDECLALLSSVDLNDGVSFAFIYKTTFVIVCESRKKASFLNKRQNRLIETIAHYRCLPRFRNIEEVRVDFKGNTEVNPFRFSVVAKARLPVVTVQAADTLSPEHWAALAQLFRGSDQDREILASMIEPGHENATLLIDMDLDVTRLVTRDINPVEEALSPLRITFDRPVRQFWHPQKLLDYKRDIMQLGKTDYIVWQAKAVNRHGVPTERECQMTGSAEIVTFQGRLHRLVRTFECRHI